MRLRDLASSGTASRVTVCRPRPAFLMIAVVAGLGFLALIVAVGATGNNSTWSALRLTFLLACGLVVEISGMTMRVSAVGEWLEIDGFVCMRRVHLSAIRFIDGESGFLVHLWNGHSIGFLGLGGSILGALTRERYARRGAAAAAAWLDRQDRPPPSLGMPILVRRRLRRDIVKILALPLIAVPLLTLILKLIFE